MNDDLSVAGPFALAPARAYRELQYRPDGPVARWLTREYDVLARPGEHPDPAAREGDLLVEVTLGHATAGACRRVVSAGDGTGPGALGAHRLLVVDLDPSQGATRLLDTRRGLPPGCLLLRARGRGGVEPDPETSDDERSPVQVDATAAVPVFPPAKRTTLGGLLTATQRRDSAAWNQANHPARSGVLDTEIAGALDSYVDSAAVATALASGAAGGAAPTPMELLTERIHQFQQKCYTDAGEHDGRAGESTLDSLGLVVRDGPGFDAADSGSADARAHVRQRNAAVRTATGNEFDATTWFSRMVDPSIFGVRTKGGMGVHLVLLRKLRRAEAALLALPAFAGMTPVELGHALGITEKHGGTRHQAGVDVHTMGLAIDISYTANPWVHQDASWRALQRAALLVGGARLTQASAPAFFHSLGPAHPTGDLWDALHRRNENFRAYFAAEGDANAVRGLVTAAVAAGVEGVARPGETPEATVGRWQRQISADHTALVASGADFEGHAAPKQGFLTHPRELAIAVRESGCLAWGAVDFGPGATASGDMMHFDARIDGVGRVLTAGTGAWVPDAGGHPCLPAAATGARRPSSADGDAAGDDPTSDSESAPDDAKQAIASLGGWGVDVGPVLAALRRLTPPEMAEIMGDGASILMLVDELSSAEQAQVGVELARGRVLGMNHADVNRILAMSARHRFGTVAAAQARHILLTHQEAVDRTGTGTVQGNHCSGPTPAGATGSDCTEYVKDVLGRTFAATGRARAWAALLAQAVQRSGAAGLKGTEMIRALQAAEGWEAVFWSPDPTDPADGQSEHPVAWKTVRAKGTYYDIAVDQARSVVGYRRHRPGRAPDLSGIAHLARLQFGVLAARGGQHMAMVVNGAVHEVHWTEPATSRDAVQATPLETFAWLSGVIAAPKGDLAQAWRTP